LEVKVLKQRVVITGVGLVTPIGIGKDNFWNALIEGKSGAGQVTYFDVSRFSTHIDAEVKNFNPGDFMEKKKIRRMDRFAQYAFAAAKMAVEDSKLDMTNEDPYKVGSITGSGIGGISTLEEEHSVVLEKGPDRISPFLIPMMISNMASGEIAIHFNAKGINYAIASACASSANAIGDAFRMIQHGEADVMITNGSDAAITPVGFGGFCAIRALSTRNSEPEKASRPFDKERDGFLMGEGGGAVIMESLPHALARNAHIYGELAGYGTTDDAYHMTAPASDGESASMAMRLALKDAGLSPENVDYINAHGTSTEMNDKIETRAIKNIFGKYAYKVPVSSTKSMMGHLLGAGGVVELIVCLLTINHGIIPATINYEFPDPECDLDYVPNKARKQNVDVAMSNSFGFGGHNAVLVAKKFQK
jgi:3-oxoacyl-[acyl-carrier-protein] synthase II